MSIRALSVGGTWTWSMEEEVVTAHPRVGEHDVALGAPAHEEAGVANEEASEITLEPVLERRGAVRPA